MDTVLGEKPVLRRVTNTYVTFFQKGVLSTRNKEYHNITHFFDEWNLVSTAEFSISVEFTFSLKRYTHVLIIFIQH